MSVLVEPKNLADLLKYEAPNHYSRDVEDINDIGGFSLGLLVARDSATGIIQPFDPNGSGGLEVPVGAAISESNSRLLFISRHAILSDKGIAWPSGINFTQKDAAIKALKVVGIVVREGA